MKKSRKLTAALTTGIMAMSLAVPAFATSYPALEVASTDLTLVINGKTIETNEEIGQPFISTENRTMVPLRLVTEELGYGVMWDNTDHSVVVTGANGLVNVEMQIGDTAYTANGVSGNFSRPLEMINDRAYLPARDFTELYGDIVWDNDTRTVTVTLDPKSQIEETTGWTFEIGAGNTADTQDKQYVVATNEKTGETVYLTGAEKEYPILSDPVDDVSHYVGTSKVIDGKLYVTVGRGGAMGMNEVCIFAGPDIDAFSQGGELTAVDYVHNGTDFTIADGYLYYTDGIMSGPWTINPNALHIAKIGSDDAVKTQEVDFAINACALSVKDGSLIATEKDGTEHVLDLMAWEE